MDKNNYGDSKRDNFGGDMKTRRNRRKKSGDTEKIVITGRKEVRDSEYSRERRNEKRKRKDVAGRTTSYFQTVLTVFLTLIIVTMAANFISKDRDFSQVENRKLREKPKFTVSGFLSGEYTKNLGTYYEDQFIGRDSFIGLKALSEKYTLRQENNGVYINDSQYLIQKFSRNTPEMTQEKASAINRFVKAHLKRNTSIMLVPNKAEVLSDRLPFDAPIESQAEYIKDFYSELTVDINKVNPTTVLKENRSSYLYFRTDHHWTQKAAYLASSQYLKSIGMEPLPEENYEILKVDNTFTGTLAALAGMVPGQKDDIDLYVPREPEDLIVTVTEEKAKFTSFYRTDKLSERDKYLVYLGGNYPVVRINTSSKNDRRLMIIKDSYANSFVPFLTPLFNEITMVDLRYYSGDVNKLVDDYNVSDILILYNVNTFSDDSSILNLTDSLDKPQEENQTTDQ